LNGSAPVFCLVDLETLRSGLAVVETKDKTANPAPLGLLGFGLTTFLLNLHNAEVFEMNTMILGMGIMYGGFAQLLAGIFEWKKGNLFAFIAFCSYGCFWISFCLLSILPKWGLGTAPTDTGLAWYLFIWGIFSTVMFVGTLKKAPWSLVFVFFTVVLLFMLLASYHWTKNKNIEKAAGIEGVICGLSAIYVAAGELLNEVWGRTMIPLGIRVPSAPKKSQ
jgi:succinate-acetate transporter protein